MTAQLGTDPGAIEQLLHDDLAHADQVMVHMGPILRHLLQNDDSSIFSDEIVSRVRGMLADIARQLIQALVSTTRIDGLDTALGKTPDTGQLTDMLAGNQALLSHLHMLAVEWQLTEKLQARIGLDPVLTPLLQDLIASPDPDTAARGMNLLAAQARFGQSMRRMQIPLAELPGDLHHIALMTMQAFAAEDPAAFAAVGQVEATLRRQRSSAIARIDLLQHLTAQLGGDLSRALFLDSAGVPIFLSALALGAGISREMAIMCTTESQMARLVLGLSASGSGRNGLVSTFSTLHPDVALPDGLDAIAPDTAAALIASSFAGREVFG
ncbi:MAG: hypothetical protein ACO1OX_08370 [Novosphingobium sp.]